VGSSDDEDDFEDEADDLDDDGFVDFGEDDDVISDDEDADFEDEADGERGASGCAVTELQTHLYEVCAVCLETLFPGISHRLHTDVSAVQGVSRCE